MEIANNILQNVLTRLENQNVELTENIRESVRDLTNSTFANLTQALTPFSQQIRQEVKRIDLSRVSEEAQQLGDKTLRLVRAYGRAPIAQAMKLNRDRLAYYFDGTKDHIDFTPSSVLVNRVGQELDKLNLKTIGISVTFTIIARPVRSGQHPAL